MALRTRVWSAGKLVLLAGALVATYVLFAAASMRVALRAREVQVPDFTNRTANEATALAADLGLGAKVDETPAARSEDRRRPRPRAGAGGRLGRAAAAQRPGLAERRPAGGDVPLLVGETERTAQLRLAQDGLDVGRRRRDPLAGLRARRRRRADAAGQERRPAASRCSSTAASAARAT